MGKVFCPCGWTISDICESKEHGDFLSSTDSIDFDDETDWLYIMGVTRNYYRCSQCGKLAMEKDNGKLEWFTPI